MYIPIHYLSTYLPISTYLSTWGWSKRAFVCTYLDQYLRIYLFIYLPIWGRSIWSSCRNIYMYWPIYVRIYMGKVYIRPWYLSTYIGICVFTYLPMCLFGEWSIRPWYPSSYVGLWNLPMYLYGQWSIRPWYPFSYIGIYVFTYLPTSLYLPTYLHWGKSKMHRYLPMQISIYVFTHLPTYLYGEGM
jgi:hypothetical protein